VKLNEAISECSSILFIFGRIPLYWSPECEKSGITVVGKMCLLKVCYNNFILCFYMVHVAKQFYPQKFHQNDEILRILGPEWFTACITRVFTL
jgi:hypothetical protein